MPVHLQEAPRCAVVPTDGPSRRDPLTLRRVLRTDDPALEHLAVLYEPSFPASERQDWHDLTVGLHDGTAVMICAEATSGPVGFLYFVLLPDSRSAALLYTVAAGGPGVGSALISFAVDELRGLGVQHGVVGEVERTQDAQSAEDAVRRRRRLLLHQRWGCALLPVPAYVMPDLSGAGEGVVPLHLVWRALDTPVSSFRKGYVRGLVAELYARVYGRTAGDPLRDRVLAGVGSGTPEWPR